VIDRRGFTDHDRSGGEAVAIVSELMARTFWPKGDAIGGRVRLANGDWIRVVGICGDVVHDWFSGRVPTLYRPLALAPTDTLALAVRVDRDPLTLVAAARGAIAQIDPAQPVFEIMTGRQVLNDRTISPRYRRWCSRSASAARSRPGCSGSCRPTFAGRSGLPPH
jgi:putative ABC transport system permease protein